MARAATGADSKQSGGTMNSQKNTSTRSVPALAALVAVGTASAADTARSAEKADRDDGLISEVIVTATRRETRLHDVAASISALDSETIENRSLVGMGDYLNSVPGISVQDMGAGRNSILIRGIGISELDRDITGVYFGEVPLTSLAYFGNADIKLVDIDRVEVLRGPQGTLYGAGAMGGAVRTIPASPDASRLDGKVSVSYSGTAEKGSDNSSIEGMVNIPLSDRFAIRAVGYRFQNSGFYENLAGSDADALAMAAQYGIPERARNVSDVGSDEYIGGRLAMAWDLTDNFRATLSYLNQELTQDGFPEVELNLGRGDWAQARLQIPASRFRTVSADGGGDQLLDDLQAANLLLEYDMGWASLTSATSWVDEYASRNLDNTSLLGFPALHLQGNGAEGLFQELRVASQLEGRVQFIAGVYYENIDRIKDVANEYDGSAADNPFDGEVVLVNVIEHGEREQKAVFGEVTYAITDKLSATGGARVFNYTVDDRIELFGMWVTPGTALQGTDQSDESYKFNLSYRPGEDQLIYAEWAQGFRLGYPQQPFIPSGCDLDDDGLIDGSNVSTGISNVDSDFLDSIELGGKFRLFGNRMTVDAAVYQAEWSGMPVFQGFACNAEVTLNLGEARSRGAEIAIAWQLTQGLRGDLSASYTDAEVAETVDGLGNKGDRLPGSPRYSYNLGLQYDFDVGQIPAFLNGNLNYRGELFNDFAADGASAGDYHVLDVRGGVTLGNAQVALFVKNLTNTDEFVWVSQLFNDGRAYRLRPRTIGLEVGYRFGRP
jgi:outer membrane receptor protein involved in Fe transport